MNAESENSSPADLLDQGAYIPGTASLVAEVDSTWREEGIICSL